MQAVVASSRTLQDINDDRVVPGDFLGVLLLLFFFMVLDRLFYTLGLHLGKVVPSLSHLSNFLPVSVLKVQWLTSQFHYLGKKFILQPKCQNATFLTMTLVLLE